MLDAFTRAVGWGNLDEAHEILKYSNSIGRPIKFGPTYLINRIYDAPAEAIQFLLDCGLDPEAHGYNNRTALIHASMNLNTRKVQILLDHGVNVNAVQHLGETALMVVAQINGNINHIGKLLLKYGADPNIQDINGRTALHKALTNNNSMLVRYLLEHGADPNIQDYNGRTVLFSISYAWCARDKLRILLEYGANTNIQNNDGLTFWNIAERNIKELAIELIRDRKSAIMSAIPFAFEAGLIDLIMEY